MPRYTVLNGFCLPTGVDAYPGEQVELADRAALPYVYKGWLVLMNDAAITAEVVDQKPAAPAPAKRGKAVDTTKEND